MAANADDSHAEDGETYIGKFYLVLSGICFCYFNFFFVILPRWAASKVVQRGPDYYTKKVSAT